MLPELATSLSTTLATASLLFFLAVYAVVVVQVGEEAGGGGLRGGDVPVGDPRGRGVGGEAGVHPVGHAGEHDEPLDLEVAGDEERVPRPLGVPSHRHASEVPGRHPRPDRAPRREVHLAPLERLEHVEEAPEDRVRLRDVDRVGQRVHPVHDLASEVLVAGRVAGAGAAAVDLVVVRDRHRRVPQRAGPPRELDVLRRAVGGADEVEQQLVVVRDAHRVAEEVPRGLVRTSRTAGLSSVGTYRPSQMVTP
jgi:hypothetical protein